jgi:hypothetical protein
MRAPLRFDAALGLVGTGLWVGQLLTAVALLSVAALGDLSLVDWATGDTRVAAVVFVGGALVACATLRVLVSALLLTTRGVRARLGRTTVGIRLVEALVACAATGLVAFVALDTAVSGEVGSLTVAVGTSHFATLVFVLAAVVVAHAAGSTVFATVRRAE